MNKEIEYEDGETSNIQFTEYTYDDIDDCTDLYCAIPNPEG